MWRFTQLIMSRPIDFIRRLINDFRVISGLLMRLLLNIRLQYGCSLINKTNFTRQGVTRNVHRGLMWPALRDRQCDVMIKLFKNFQRFSNGTRRLFNIISPFVVDDPYTISFIIHRVPPSRAINTTNECNTLRRIMNVTIMTFPIMSQYFMWGQIRRDTKVRLVRTNKIYVRFIRTNTKDHTRDSTRDRSPCCVFRGFANFRGSIFGGVHWCSIQGCIPWTIDPSPRQSPSGFH